MKELKQITEEFIYRIDKILKRVTNYETGWIIEYFDHGRSKHLKGIYIYILK